MSLIFYTDRFIGSEFAAKTFGPVILIRPKYRGDTGLLEHEKTHVRQWLNCPVGSPLMYLFSKRYRLNAEVEAYKRQMQFYPDDRAKLFAGFIATRYSLGITAEEAERLLRK